MSFGRFPRFEDDPFFSSTMLPFPSFPAFGFPSMQQQFPSMQQQFPSIQQQEGRSNRRSERELRLMDPFSMFSNNMEQMMNAAGTGGQPGNGHYFSTSSVMHYSNTAGSSEPQVYHATSSVTGGPGGVKETRKTESDSRSGNKKMAIGHHIGDRSHTIEKRENMRTKDREQHQQFINLDDDDAAHFDQEWQKKTSSFRQLGLQSDHYANRRGLGGVPDISRPSNRDHRSRSPEKRRHKADGDRSHHKLPSHADADAARRQEYLKQRDDRKVRF